jgi:hypothetical protein
MAKAGQTISTNLQCSILQGPGRWTDEEWRPVTDGNNLGTQLQQLECGCTGWFRSVIRPAATVPVNLRTRLVSNMFKVTTDT